MKRISEYKTGLGGIFLAIFFLLFVACDDATTAVTQYTVAFNLDGGTLNGQYVYEISVTKGSKVDKPADPVKLAHEFLGWYVGSALDSAEFDFATTIIETDNVVIYGRWQSKADSDAISDVEAILDIGYASGDDAFSVTQDIILPVSLADGVSIKWESSNIAVISENGVVTRPASGASDENIVMTATIEKGEASLSKVFNLIVRIEGDSTIPTSSDYVAAAKATSISRGITYAVDDNMSNVTQDIILLTSGGEGVAITWASDSAAITVDGKAGTVARPASGEANATVTLTASISKDGESDTVTFVLIVLAEDATGATDDEALAAAKAALHITYASGDDANHVTQDLGLPSTDAINGVTIVWSSGNAAITVTGNEGTVIRPGYGSNNETFDLIATLEKNGVSVTKTFTVMVLAYRLPGAPRDVTLLAPDDRSLVVSWSIPSDTGSTAIVKYSVYYSTTSITDTSEMTPIDTADDSTTATISADMLQDNTQYFVVVRAHNDGGEGPVSAEVTATTAIAPVTEP